MNVNHDMNRALVTVLLLEVSARAGKLAIALMQVGIEANRVTRVGVARSRLTKMTGLSKDGVDSAVDELVDARLIVILNRGCFSNGKRHTHQYDLRPLFRRFHGLFTTINQENA